ncbi:MAG: acyltransferase family protein [Gemmataceae bacterium]
MGHSSSDSSSLPAGRLISVDAYRGFTMLAMASAGLSLAGLLNQHNLHGLAHQLDHEEWQGCTAWDLIQPSFMFLVGVAMPFSFARRQQQGATWGSQFRHALIRCLLLALIGMLMDTYFEHIVYIQFIRVLQQIALAYILVFLVLHLGPRIQGAVLVAVLAVHPALYLLYARAHGLENAWQPDANLGTRIDEWLSVPSLLSQHISFMPVSKGHYVTFNAFSSAATLLSGVLVGELLRSRQSAFIKFLVMLLAGIGCLFMGEALTPIVPMIKRLWTTSFAVYAGGWTLILMAGFYLVIDVLELRSWAFPLVVVGMNSIAMYVFSSMLRSENNHVVEPFLQLAKMPQEVFVFLVAVAALGLKWLFCYWLYRHKIFVRV